ncbi:MAG: iron-containing alcohol dehydrogenase, partial [Christensenellaceae bacterium]|nr:iron-containing alcohol dehydrogenase [Christensenellaceae bacterium]
ASYSCSMTLAGLKTTVPARMPVAICADVDILRKAPLYLALSGFGDMMGKYIALADWKLAALLGDGSEPFDEEIAAGQLKATALVKESAPLLATGDPEAYRQLIYGLVLSGIAMQQNGSSRPAAGAEHYISHFMEMGGLGYPVDALHGEKVGVGTLMALAEYKRILQAGPAVFSAFPRPMPTEAAIRSQFGTLADSILQINKECDPLAGVTREKLQQNWPHISAILQELPDLDELTTLYKAIGAKGTMADLGNPTEAHDIALRWSPCARTKLTLLRIAAQM